MDVGATFGTIGIHPLAAHQLVCVATIKHVENRSRKAKPITQQKRKIDRDRCKAIEQEIAKLRVARFMREVTYTMWLSNMVLVKKNNGK
ncbi:hypothetical protein CR513_61697, partial [Mucuna pruriens]